MTKEQEEAIRERDKKTKRGPWAWTHDRYTFKMRGRKLPAKVTPLLLQGVYPGREYRDAFDDVIFSVHWPIKKGEINFSGLDETTKEFIAHSREDIPLLLGEIDRLRDLIDEESS
jgi:hypothetical protein